jgi:hypothetical protein
VAQLGPSADVPRVGETRAPARPQAGDALLHPLAIGAVAVLVVNDHLLKAAYPGLVTGKLSDVAGLVFFPLLLVGLAEVVLAAAGRWTAPSQAALRAAVVLTACLFAAAKATAAGALAAGIALGILRWAPGALAAVLAGSPVPGFGPAAVTVDPTDLLALPALLAALAVGGARVRSARSGVAP